MTEHQYADRSATLGALAKAKAMAQAKFTAIGKDKTANAGKYSYAYAGLDTCLEAVVPALSEVGIALFQPTRVEQGQAIASTLLVHESGEYLSGDYAVAIVDPTDAQSIGSATTYARRYGLLAMLGVAAGAEDDDGQAARGGNHPMATPASAPPCPACGVVGSLMKGSASFGGGVVCWAKRGGCGVKWPEGTPYPPTKVPEKGAPPAAKGRPKTILEAAQADPMTKYEPVRDLIVDYAISPQPPPPGADDCPVLGCWGGRDHPGAHVFEAEAEALKTKEVAMPKFRPFGGKVEITTQGMTQAQFEESHRLATILDKSTGKATARGILADLLGLPVDEATRKMLTEAQAAEYLLLLTKAIQAAAAAL